MSLAEYSVVGSDEFDEECVRHHLKGVIRRVSQELCA